MNESNKIPLIIAFVALVALFLIFGGGAMTGSMMGGGMGRGTISGFNWMWIPTFLAFALGIPLAWALFGKRSH